MNSCLLRISGLVCLCFALCLSASASTATFQIVQDPITNTWSNFALSGNGDVMAANYGGEIYRWTATSGFQDLGPGDPYSSSIGISRDGSAIISGYIGSDGYSRPAIWKSSGLTDLGHPSNGCTAVGNSWGSGYSLNANGTVAVGLAWNCQDAEAFAWTKATGNVSLGHPAGTHSSRASAISANSATVVGFWEDVTGPRRPVRWLNGKHDLFLGSKTLGEATALTSNGKNIVGQYYDVQNNGIAFLYSDSRGFTSLGTIRHGRFEQSIANGISDDGTVIGWSGDPFGHGIQAFVWTPGHGMVLLARMLRQAGAKIPAGTTLYTAISISADETTFAGQYFDAQGHFGNWMAHITK
jgi:probable HAF family extracellular repeat protein